MPADDSHEISCIICYFWKKSSKSLDCRLLQIIGDALCVKYLTTNYTFFFHSSHNLFQNIL